MTSTKRGITLIELLVVLAIVGLLATIAAGVYTNSVQRAKVSATFAEIQQISMAVEQYRLDMGEYPPSSSGTLFSPDLLDPHADGVGCGYLHLAIVHSLNADATTPLNSRWSGPYLELDSEQTGTYDGTPIAGKTAAEIQLLDVWGTAYRFVLSSDYATMQGTQLPTDDPFYATETYYNVSTFQIVSNGPNTTTKPDPEIGLENDDITNFTR